MYHQKSTSKVNYIKVFYSPLSDSIILARKVAKSVNGSKVHGSAISYFPIAPPGWARIPSDPPSSHPTAEPGKPPSLIRIGPASSCNCRAVRCTFDPEAPIETIPCTVYDIWRIWETAIQVQSCPTCNLPRIGPDCRELGLFNYNNKVLFTHSLLNDYINAYTASETPFASWSIIISRRYSALPTSPKFVVAKELRNIWFAYAKLLQFGNDDMMCPQCGPNPSAVIWDGVSISFPRDKTLPSLCPPTVITSRSAAYEDTVRVKGTQCIPDRGLRMRIRDIINGPPLAGSTLVPEEQEESGSGSDAEQIRGARAAALAQRKANLRRRFDLIPGVIEGLSAVNPDLGCMFAECFGAEAVLRKASPPREYKELILQVLSPSIFLLV